MSDDKNEKRMDRMEGNIAVLQTDVAVLKTDVAVLKTDMSDVKDVLKQIMSMLIRIDHKVNELPDAREFYELKGRVEEISRHMPMTLAYAPPPESGKKRA